MIITVVGLGLIGGSLCKTIKKHTSHKVLGVDINKETLDFAMSQGSIDGVSVSPDEADLTIVCLYPYETIEYIKTNAERFKKGSIVSDVCGVKTAIVDAVSETLDSCGVTFIGAHPMAGREFSGYEYSQDSLFDGASYIITPSGYVSEKKLRFLEDFAYSLNFDKVVVATPQEHDSIIAFTSQLAHVVSNGYIKSPTHQKECGFSAGSFQDLTRVATLNEHMWTALFLLNKGPLIKEIDCLADRLKEYRDAISADDSERLTSLLREGRILKDESNRRLLNLTKKDT